jgi:Peptidase family M23
MQILVSFLVPTALATLVAASALPVTSAAPVNGPVVAPVTVPIPAPIPAPVTAPITAAATGVRTPPATEGMRSPGGIALPRLVPVTVTWPLSPRPVVHRRFEPPRAQWSRGHRGVDLVAARGQPVLSAGEGVVAFSGVVAGRGVITVRHSGGMRTSYEPVEQRLTAGAHVQQGSRIGVISATAGHCVPLTCLHWGAIFGEAYRDPLSLLGIGGPGFGRPILLPLG